MADYFGFLGVGLGTGSVFWFGVVVADVLLAVDVGRGKRSMSSKLVIGTDLSLYCNKCKYSYKYSPLL